MNILSILSMRCTHIATIAGFDLSNPMDKNQQ